MLGLLGDGNLRQQRLGRPTPLQQMRGRLGLNHTCAALRQAPGRTVTIT
jgi:hypothetical protein